MISEHDIECGRSFTEYDVRIEKLKAPVVDYRFFQCMLNRMLSADLEMVSASLTLTAIDMNHSQHWQA